MNREGKYRIVLIEPSEIVAAGIGAIIDKNPEFSLMQTLSNPGYFNANNSEIDIIIINPAVIDYNERLDIRSYLGNTGAAIVALTHSSYEESVLRQYDECIGSMIMPHALPRSLRAPLTPTHRTRRTTSTNFRAASATSWQQWQRE